MKQVPYRGPTNSMSHRTNLVAPGDMERGICWIFACASKTGNKRQRQIAEPQMLSVRKNRWVCHIHCLNRGRNASGISDEVHTDWNKKLKTEDRQTGSLMVTLSLLRGCKVLSFYTCNFFSNKSACIRQWIEGSGQLCDSAGRPVWEIASASFS